MEIFRKIPRAPTDALVAPLWHNGWAHIDTLVDLTQQPAVLLDNKLRVSSANPSFYKIFQVSEKETEQNNIYQLGNGQWNAPELRKLLEEILLKNNSFKGLKISHNFPNIGQKIMMLNGRVVYFENTAASEKAASFILLVMEDTTELMVAAENMADQSNQLEYRLAVRRRKLEIHIERLEKEIGEIRKNI